MKRRILIYGKVHNVGYRPFLLGIAESLEIERFYADNVVVDGKEAIEIHVDSDKEKIDGFIELIKSKRPERAVVEDIKILKYEGHVMKTESYYRYLTSLQLSTIATYGGYMLEKQDVMLNKMDEMLEKQDKMLEKQDIMLGKMDLMLKKQDETISEVRALRTDLRSYMDERFRKLEEEIRIIKEKLGLI